MESCPSILVLIGSLGRELSGWELFGGELFSVELS